MRVEATRWQCSPPSRRIPRDSQTRVDGDMRSLSHAMPAGRAGGNGKLQHKEEVVRSTMPRCPILETVTTYRPAVRTMTALACCLIYTIRTTRELLLRAGLGIRHKFLELGCGLGYVSRRAATQASHVTGLDLSEEHLAEADRIGQAAGLRKHRMVPSQHLRPRATRGNLRRYLQPLDSGSSEPSRRRHAQIARITQARRSDGLRGAGCGFRLLRAADRGLQPLIPVGKRTLRDA